MTWLPVLVRRLEQDGVHPHLGLAARGLGLHDLRAAHLEPVAPSRSC
jgi:hypothetical protein